jgi:uncharacterized membrane protein
MANVLVVAVFEHEQTAWNAVVTAAELAAQGTSGLHDACLVVRAEDGTVHMRETKDISPTKAAWYGGAWGLLGGAVLGFPLAIAAGSAGVGAFVARRRDLGITDDFEQTVAEKLEPGRSAAVVLVDDELVSRVESTARELGAWTRTVTLADAKAITASK